MDLLNRHARGNSCAAVSHEPSFTASDLLHHMFPMVAVEELAGSTTTHGSRDRVPHRQIFVDVEVDSPAGDHAENPQLCLNHAADRKSTVIYMENVV